TLGQRIGVTQAVDVLLLVVTDGAARISHAPRRHDLTGTDGSAQTYGVRIDAHAVVGHQGAGGAQVSEGDALEPAVTGLTKAGVQLDNLEVIAGAHVPRLDLHAAIRIGRSVGESIRRLKLIIGSGNADGAVVVPQTGSPGVSIGVITTALTEALRTVGVERITDTELEARVAWGLVHDQVVVAQACSRVERRTGSCLTKVNAKRAGDACEVLAGDVGLTTEVEATPCIRLKTNGSLTTKHAVGVTQRLTRHTGTQIKAAFKYEDRLKAVAQVFRTLQTPAVGGVDAVDHARAFAVVINRRAGCIDVCTLQLLVADTPVDDTVEGDRRFCVGRTSGEAEAGSERCSEQSLFHLRNLRRF